MRCAKYINTFSPPQTCNPIDVNACPIGLLEVPTIEVRAPTKGPFTEWEDNMIRKHVKEHGPHKWPMLSKEMKTRNPKQCRERWANHLNPAVSKAKWTQEEDHIIMEKYKQFGPRWALISKFLTGRTDNSVKNRWHATLSKRFSLNEMISLHSSNKYSSGISSPEPEIIKEGQKQSKRIILPSLLETFPLEFFNSSFFNS